MLTGLGRLGAVVWEFVGLWLFWLLTSIAFDGPVLARSGIVKAWAFIAIAMGRCYMRMVLPAGSWVVPSASRHATSFSSMLFQRTVGEHVPRADCVI